jgi:hypothetical protein
MQSSDSFRPYGSLQAADLPKKQTQPDPVMLESQMNRESKNTENQGKSIVVWAHENSTEMQPTEDEKADGN